MKAKHIKARIRMCLELAELSNCPRRKFGALLLDPERNQVIGEGYNGGPRGGGKLCGGDWCLRNGSGALRVKPVWNGHSGEKVPRWYRVTTQEGDFVADYESEVEAKAHPEYPPIKSGTEIQIGCHHSEMNVICNAAASGVKCAGAWLIVTGEPCIMCSKLIHHAGITKVLIVDGGYIGANGVQYLRQHGVEVEGYDGPKDPRV